MLSGPWVDEMGRKSQQGGEEALVGRDLYISGPVWSFRHQIHGPVSPLTHPFSTNLWGMRSHRYTTKQWSSPMKVSSSLMPWAITAIIGIPVPPVAACAQSWACTSLGWNYIQGGLKSEIFLFRDIDQNAIC